MFRFRTRRPGWICPARLRLLFCRIDFLGEFLVQFVLRGYGTRLSRKTSHAWKDAKRTDMRVRFNVLYGRIAPILCAEVVLPGFDFCLDPRRVHCEVLDMTRTGNVYGIRGGCGPPMPTRTGGTRPRFPQLLNHN